MPIYEYQCQKCHHHFEEIQKLNDPPVVECPKCAGSVKQLISQTSFALKGEGWYKDGYAKPAGQKETPTTAVGTGKPADTKAADAKPAESKPATQPSIPAQTGPKGR